MSKNTKTARNQETSNLLIGSSKDWVSWIELIIISLLSVLLWRYQAELPHDKAEDYFYWAMIGPVLIALRYGFARGFISFLITIIVSYLWLEIGNLSITLSLPVAVGTGLVTMIAGEFRDSWSSTIERYALNNRYIEQRLASFSQNYHLLRISHNQLEQRMVGAQVSLRTSLQGIQELAGKEQTVNELVAQRSVQEIGSVITLYSAGFYAVSNNEIADKPLWSIGKHKGLQANHPMVQDSLTSQLTVAPRVYLDDKTKIESFAKTDLPYQLVIPFIDIEENVRALVVAESVRFVQLTDNNIALVHLIASCVANFISQKALTPLLSVEQKKDFLSYIHRQQKHSRHYHIDSAFVIFHDTSDKQYINLDSVTDFRRGPDVYWLSKCKQGKKAVCVLLPTTTLKEAEQYVERIKILLAENHENILTELVVYGPLLVDNQEDKLNALLENFGVKGEDYSDLTSTHT